MSASLVKILMTTRCGSVAQSMQTVPTFYLGYMSEEQSWQLFQHYAGEVIQDANSNLVDIGKQIMKKCGMLPLAIKSIASLLRHEPKEESWREILENELWNSDVSGEIFRPLQISYARLPTHLKPCFLYCSMFSRNYHYNAKELVQLWIYQGYVQTNGRKNAEKIGWDHVKLLWQRSFFEGEYGEKEFHFTLHDMVYDLACMNSRHGCSVEGDMVGSFPEELYHWYVGDWVEPIGAPPSGKFGTLRTLIVNSCAKIFHSGFDFSKAQKLRALQLGSSNCYFELHFSFVNLKHLRYLSFSDGLFERLPEFICSLYNLLNLTLKICCHLTELPEIIGNLLNLEELTIMGCEDLRVLPMSLCELMALRKLTLFWCSKLEELPPDMGNLVNLQFLRICNTNVSSLPPSLNKIIRIPELEVRLKCRTTGWLKDFVVLEGTLCLVGLSSVRGFKNVLYANLMSMRNLQCLVLNWFNDRDELNAHSEGNLIELYIESNADGSYKIDLDEEEDSVIDDEPCSLMVRLQPHPNLKDLRILGYPGLTFPDWIGNPSLCASLTSIELVRCKSLILLPFGSHDKLKYLKLEWCSSLKFIHEESLPLVLEERNFRLRKLNICDGNTKVELFGQTGHHQL